MIYTIQNYKTTMGRTCKIKLDLYQYFGTDARLFLAPSNVHYTASIHQQRLVFSRSLVLQFRSDNATTLPLRYIIILKR